MGANVGQLPALCTELVRTSAKLPGPWCIPIVPSLCLLVSYLFKSWVLHLIGRLKRAHGTPLPDWLSVSPRPRLSRANPPGDP
jgi:hypothetical protein